MKKEINLIYKPVADTDSEEARRRVEAAFDVLFNSVFEGIFPLRVEAPLPNVSVNPKEIRLWQIRR